MDKDSKGNDKGKGMDIKGKDKAKDAKNESRATVRQSSSTAKRQAT